jgi:hypothetical protein
MRNALFIGLLSLLPLKLFSQNKNNDFGIKTGIAWSFGLITRVWPAGY